MAKQEAHPQEEQLILKLLEYKDDPLGFVLYAFPWGQPNTPLANHDGPRKWQREALGENDFLVLRENNHEPMYVVPHNVWIRLLKNG